MASARKRRRQGRAAAHRGSQCVRATGSRAGVGGGEPQGRATGEAVQGSAAACRPCGPSAHARVQSALELRAPPSHGHSAALSSPAERSPANPAPRVRGRGQPLHTRQKPKLRPAPLHHGRRQCTREPSGVVPESAVAGWCHLLGRQLALPTVTCRDRGPTPGRTCIFGSHTWTLWCPGPQHQRKGCASWSAAQLWQGAHSPLPQRGGIPKNTCGNSAVSGRCISLTRVPQHLLTGLTCRPPACARLSAKLKRGPCSLQSGGGPADRLSSLR